MARGTSYRFSLAGWLLVTIALATALIWLAFPVGAAPGLQGDENLPTPTLYPVQNTPYTLSVVGGKAETYTFDHENQNGFVFGQTTVTSEYPLGMTFTLEVSSETSTVDEVILFVRFVHDSGTRAQAKWDAERGVWVARLWEAGGQPAWTHFDFHWRVRDATGAFVDTEDYPMDYWDPDHQWYRSESEHLVLYWRDFGTDNPDAIAQKMADTIAALEKRRVEGFGAPLSYKPIAVIYPDRDSLSAMYGSGVSNTRAAGFTSSDLGISVQVLRGTEIPPNQENCVWVTPPEEWTMERRINTIYATTGHELVHLTQYETMGGMMGYLWFSEGQAEWFTSEPGLYDRRLRHLATLQDLPTLQMDYGWQLNQADGCYGLPYDMGASFLNFLMYHYGGVDFHLQLVRKMRGEGKSVFKAVEDLTGKPFLEVENEWRTYLGFRPLTPADLDPALALEPYEDALFAVGDTITLPAMPPIVQMFKSPVPRAALSGSCFANTPVKVLRMGQKDGTVYIEIDCMGMIGWVSREALVGPQ